MSAIGVGNPLGWSSCGLTERTFQLLRSADMVMTTNLCWSTLFQVHEICEGGGVLDWGVTVICPITMREAQYTGWKGRPRGKGSTPRTSCSSLASRKAEVSELSLPRSELVFVVGTLPSKSGVEPFNS